MIKVQGEIKAMVWALLPLKNLVSAKQRLSGVLAPSERGALFQAMVEDVLTVLTQTPEITRITIVSEDPYAKWLAAYFKVDYLSERSLNTSGLNNTVNAAAALLQKQGANTLLVIHGDLPIISTAQLSRFIQSHYAVSKPAFSIIPDRHNIGSNCVLQTPPLAVAYGFGEHSFRRHCDAALKNNVVVNTFQSNALAYDIDEPDDLMGLPVLQGTRTQQYLNESGIEKRLKTMALKNPLPSSMISCEEALALSECEDLPPLMQRAKKLRDHGFLNVVSYSKKVFIPLTQLCRDVCHYCTFAKTPKNLSTPYMSMDEILASARIGAAQGCKEALFTLGEKPELRYPAAQQALKDMGFNTTLEYLAFAAKTVLDETGLLPHINAGCMTAQEIDSLRPVSASIGIMLESASERLCEKGMPHYGSPDKLPAQRLKTIELAGQAKVPLTTGILIGIGETRRERIESLLALRKLHQRFGHIQEIIVQNFRAKDGTKMALSPEPDLADLLWTIAVARIIFGAQMSIQVPPNLSPGVLPQFIEAGINDWGGVSPITPDYVNPEAPWPQLNVLAKETAQAGKVLQQRLTIYPHFVLAGNQWLDSALYIKVRKMTDTEGYPRTDDWCAGKEGELPKTVIGLLGKGGQPSKEIESILQKISDGISLDEPQIIRLFQSRGGDFTAVTQMADKLRQQACGDKVSYVVNRNINYTNICYFKCQFCAFSKGKHSDEDLRGKPYNLGLDDVAKRCEEAWQRGATEVCLQGGIHPDYTGQTYLDIVRAVKDAVPEMHLHAFSPLEIFQGAATLNVSVKEFLQQLKAAGLNTLPGTAAEILDDEVRATLCSDKITSQQWLDVMETAHELGFKTTATIMFGHIDGLQHWARHLLKIKALQQRTRGFTEFVPLPFVHMEAPNYRRGLTRQGPTFREALLMHAVARLVLYPEINNIQVSWVKMGLQGAVACLQAGANDLGGTLMDESITRAAGARHGQEMSKEQIAAMLKNQSRHLCQRDTLYGDIAAEEALSFVTF